jgi:hypothetical protein
MFQSNLIGSPEKVSGMLSEDFPPNDMLFPSQKLSSCVRPRSSEGITNFLAGCEGDRRGAFRTHDIFRDFSEKDGDKEDFEANFKDKADPSAVSVRKRRSEFRRQ